MNKDKQIEEMRHLADEMGKAISTEYEKRVLADERKLEAVLKANGWRKATDVAREIFTCFDEHAVNLNFVTGNFEVNFGRYLEIKKEYTESEGTE